MPPWLIAMIVNVVLNIAIRAITPQPKGPKPPSVTQAEAPTASAGIPMGFLWGTVRLTGPNCLWYGDVSTNQYKVKV